MGQGYTPVDDKMERDIAQKAWDSMRRCDALYETFQIAAREALIPLYSGMDETWDAIVALNSYMQENKINGTGEHDPTSEQWKKIWLLLGDVQRNFSNVDRTLARPVDNPEGKQLHAKVYADHKRQIKDFRKQPKRNDW